MPFGWPERVERPVPTILKDLFETQTASALLKRLPTASRAESRKELISIILSGGYPEPAMMKSSEVRYRWFDSYRQTYLERDLLNIKSIENIPDFNRLLSLRPNSISYAKSTALRDFSTACCAWKQATER
jgi:predicted AAA+ superfamily ATPase